MRPNTLTLLLLLMANVSTQVHGQQDSLSAMWWNVENFFDLRDDPATADEEFTPAGDRHWTRKRFNRKRDGIYKTIVAAGLPDVVGLAEVENKYVLRELCEGTPLAKEGYRYVHFDSPDRRGIDCALLYRSSRFSVFDSQYIRVSDSSAGFFTRDILLVEGVTAEGDTVCFLLNHWPSRRGGDEADERRMAIAHRLRDTMNALHRQMPTALVLAMGDMNATRDDPALYDGMGFGVRDVNDEGIANLTRLMPHKWGSYRYQGLWDYIDAFFMLADESWSVGEADVFYPDFLLIDEASHHGKRPHRTYRGPVYEGGLSDHLPLRVRLARQRAGR